MPAVRYKQPRVLNVVSVTFLLVLVSAGYAAYEYVGVLFQRQEAYRVLEEHGSKLAARHKLYIRDNKEREVLRKHMHAELVRMGIEDPEMQTWIEVDTARDNPGGPAGGRLGVVYTSRYHWPFDMLPPITRDEQVEHQLMFRAN